jgi:HSP20 family protein
MTTQEVQTTREEQEHKGRGLQRYRSGQFMSPLEEFERVFERAFDQLMPRGWLRPWLREWPALGELAHYEARIPRIDMIDRESEIVLRAEVPGVSKDDLDVSVTDDAVTIRGEVKREAKEEKGEYYYREMSYGGFSRTLPLPAGVDVERAKVTFKDGILTMTLPKVETAKPRKIEIQEA